MTIIVNLFVLILISFMMFTIARQGLVDLDSGLTGTIFFTTIVVLYLVVIFRMILQNIAAGKDHDSIKDFFSTSWQTGFRGEPDLVLKAVSWIGTLCWGLLVMALASVKEAAKTKEEAPVALIEIPETWVDIMWHSKWTSYAYIITILMAIFSAIALFLKSRRNKRTVDRYPINIILLFIISVIATFYFY
ncbi:MAG: hypothetical protein HQL71_01430 [Magnetococcales bacterium]|nr:hypothetical protein [Magnetococcales bacterium]